MTTCRCCGRVVLIDEVLWCLDEPPVVDLGQEAGRTAVRQKVFQVPIAGAAPCCPQCVAAGRDCCIEVAQTPARIETCWRLVGPSRKVVECGIYRLAGTSVFEVRASYSTRDVIELEVEPTLYRARARAAAWKAAILAKGGFKELLVE